MTTTPAVSIRNLKIELPKGAERPYAVDGISIDLVPGETAEIIMRFGGYPGRYVFHCHNLEHEDMAMMANFSVG